MFMDLIKNQKVEGFWVLSEENCMLINEKEEGILKSIPKSLEVMEDISKRNIWFTSLVLSWISKYFSKDKGSLVLIITKAKLWIKQQGFDLNTLLKDSVDFFSFN